MGRSVKKDVYTYSAGAWNLTSTKLFVYNGWNLIQELDGSGTTEKSYVWGLDLSGTLQGSGGVGGLLSRIEHQATSIQLYGYDANGNVGQMFNASDGLVQAHYEYDPFGKEVFSYGDLTAENPFRFSTKYFHVETDLYYYGYRYYSQELGRWINRDPTEEKGGLNLYLFISNNSINLYDLLGLWELDKVLSYLEKYDNKMYNYLTKRNPTEPHDIYDPPTFLKEKNPGWEINEFLAEINRPPYFTKEELEDNPSLETDIRTFNNDYAFINIPSSYDDYAATVALSHEGSHLMFEETLGKTKNHCDKLEREIFSFLRGALVYKILKIKHAHTDNNEEKYLPHYETFKTDNNKGIEDMCNYIMGIDVYQKKYKNCSCCMLMQNCKKKNKGL